MCLGKLIEKLQEVISNKNEITGFEQVLVIPIQAFYTWSRELITDEEIVGILKKIANQGCCSCVYYDDEKQIEYVKVGWFKYLI